jgi:hypothetical protein
MRGSWRCRGSALGDLGRDRGEVDEEDAAEMPSVVLATKRAQEDTGDVIAVP